MTPTSITLHQSRHSMRRETSSTLQTAHCQPATSMASRRVTVSRRHSGSDAAQAAADREPIAHKRIAWSSLKILLYICAASPEASGAPLMLFGWRASLAVPAPSLLPAASPRHARVLASRPVAAQKSRAARARSAKRHGPQPATVACETSTHELLWRVAQTLLTRAGRVS